MIRFYCDRCYEESPGGLCSLDFCFSSTTQSSFSSIVSGLCRPCTDDIVSSIRSLAGKAPVRTTGKGKGKERKV